MDKNTILEKLKSKIQHLEVKQLTENIFLLKGFYREQFFKSSVLYNYNKKSFSININGESLIFENKRVINKLNDDFNNKAEVYAPMTGIIKEVLVFENEKVVNGQILLKIESMKMVLNITATCDGLISEMKAEKDKKVSSGDFLMRIKND